MADSSPVPSIIHKKKQNMDLPNGGTFKERKVMVTHAVR